MTIKVLEKTLGCSPVIFKQGDWYDLCLAEDVTLKGPHAKTLHHKLKEGQVDKYRDVVFDSCIASLGVCMQIPKGYEAIVVPRSSTFRKYGIIQSNSFGVIDNSYCSDKDVWGMPIVATRKVTIPKGTRVAQFRIQLSQKATAWQKIKWLFSSKVTLKRVSTLNNKERGGFGSTGN
jgi:dUTP pyrophosphatase